jgi:hypothetical protein
MLANLVLSIVLLTKLAGGDLGALFLKKGDLRWGLRFGGISFAVFAVNMSAVPGDVSRFDCGHDLLR